MTTQALLATDGLPEKAAIIAESIIEELPVETVRVARQCVFLHWFDASIIEVLVEGISLNQEGSTDLYEQIISLPFIHPVDQGRVAFHDLTREGLLRRYAINHPELLISAAKILAPVYLAHGMGRVSITEAFFCCIIAGQPEVAVGLLNTLFEEAIHHEDWVYMSGLIHLQEEAEQLPFVQHLPLTEQLWMMRGIIHNCSGSARGSNC